MTRTFLQSDKIRVLVNGIHAKSGGGVTYLRNIIPLMARREELVLHVFLHRNQFDLFHPLPENVRLHLLEFNPGFLKMLLWEQLSLPLLARVMSADVTFSPANYGPLLAPKQVIVLRNSLAVVGREKRISKWLYWFVMTIMTAISLLTSRKAIAVSEYARKALAFGVRGKISVVHHGVKDIFRPAKRKRKTKAPFLLVVADIYVQKNLHTVLEAMGRLRETFPDLILKIAGSKTADEDYFHEMEGLVTQLKLDEAVQFLGPLPPEKLVTLYQDCRVFVFPSTVETFGNPLVEAMACGAPIASSNTAAMPEVVGEAAVFFDPLKADEMAGKIEQILTDKTLRGELSRKSLEQAKAYSWKITADKTVDILVEASGLK